MTKGKKFKAKVLARMAETGERYQAAHAAVSTRVDTLGILAWCPQRMETLLRDGWVIAAESWPLNPQGVVWDVRAEHPDGSRIPLGHNWHEDPGPEMARLAVVIG